MNPIALLFDRTDAERFERDRPDVKGVIVLTPEAWGALGSEARSLVAADPVNDWSHARIAARGRRAAAIFNAEIDKDQGLRAGTCYWLAFIVQIQAYLAARTWEVLRSSGPWLLHREDEWRQFDDRAATQQHMMERLSARLGPDTARTPAQWFYRLLLRGVMLVLRSRGPWVLTTRIKLVYGLDRLMIERRPRLRILTLEPRSRGVHAFRLLWQALREGLTGAPAVTVPIPARPRVGAGAAVEQALAAITDPIIARGLTKAFRTHILDETAHCETLYDEALAAIRPLAPKAYVNRQDSGRQGIVAESAGAAGVPRYVINYNSFPPADSAIADDLLRFFFHVRMPEGLSDNFVLWSPHIAKLSARVYSPAAQRSVRPLRLEPPPIDSLIRRPGPYRVLHASNFTEWGYFFPWIMETSTEFLQDILVLAEELGSLSAIELTVRTKSKSECSPETLRRLMPETANCKVTGLETPFVEALGDADLLIGFMSTTIEEAVLYRTPVLLWGPTGRYCHLPARSIPPTPDDRAAVYVCHRRENLASMVLAIVEAHAARPLSDAEVAEHVWPEGTPTLEDLACDIAGASDIPLPKADRSALGQPASNLE